MSPQIDWVRRGVGISLLLLVAVTWRLWFSPGPFPQVPLFRFAVALPTSIDSIVATLMVIGSVLTISIRTARGQSFAMLMTAACLAVLFVADQHRLQPWAFQIFWFLIAMALCRAAVAMRMMRGLVVSIYLFSGISKLDYQFVYTTGREFLGGLVAMAGGSIETWPEMWKVAATLSFPVGELVIAVALIFARTRRPAVCMAVTMHLVLFLLLGPFGLNHQPGVLIWNLCSATLVGLLFWKLENGGSLKREEVLRSEPPTHLQPLAVGLLAAVSVAPVLEPFGFYDHWLAWGLYAPHNSRVKLLVDERVVDRLPPSLRTHTTPVAEGSRTRQVNLDRWSIACLSVPIYPQSRFQTGVALAVLRQSQLNNGFWIEIQSDSNRRTGQRTVEEFGNLDQLKLQMSHYQLNALPRAMR
ncbi:hypothetical protein [Rosistilla carotiformis]|uniref:hypothetical protein n=1 Tax=Rosistilla carotiformis TaxID=2528017 RepID=UPI0011A60678|nr:hypothetical protein [Rosistilla carotiformis]